MPSPVLGSAVSTLPLAHAAWTGAFKIPVCRATPKSACQSTRRASSGKWRSLGAEWYDRERAKEQESKRAEEPD
eukprot:3580154-Pyramimonas_sp.AAC.1